MVGRQPALHHRQRIDVVHGHGPVARWFGDQHDDPDGAGHGRLRSGHKSGQGESRRVFRAGAARGRDRRDCGRRKAVQHWGPAPAPGSCRAAAGRRHSVVELPAHLHRDAVSDRQDRPHDRRRLLTIMRLALALKPAALALIVSGLTAAPCAAQTTTIRVYESTFDEVAAKLQPVQLSGRHAFTVSAWTPFGPATMTICDSAWNATVSQLKFSITPVAVGITGRLDARWCNISFFAALSTSANVTYSAGQKAMLVSVNPTSLQPSFSVLGYNVALPVFINVAPYLTLPPIPFDVAPLQFETARGPVSLRVSPENVSLNKRSGYMEIQADVVV